MKTLDKKAICRKLLLHDHKHNQVLVKIAPEGLYFKKERSRWSGATFLPWGTAWVAAIERWSKEQKRLRAERRKQKKMGVII